MSRAASPDQPGRRHRVEQHRRGFGGELQRQALSFGKVPRVGIDITDHTDLRRYEIRVDGSWPASQGSGSPWGRSCSRTPRSTPRSRDRASAAGPPPKPLRDVRGRDLVVVRTCPFIADYLKRHPDAVTG